MSQPTALGDEDADLIRQLYAPLRRLASVVAPAEVDPDDLVQEAFLRVFRSRRLDELDDPLRYLRRTLVNLASNHRRRLGRARRAGWRIGVGAETDVAPSYPSDLDDLLALPADVRAALYLAEIEGYTFAEIGAVLGCTEAAARKRAWRGRIALRDHIEGAPS